MDSVREKARTAIEDAVFQALEAGMTKDEIEAEFKYALESAEE
jgi:N-acetylglucosamine kinase-like BadF-type ATPase